MSHLFAGTSSISQQALGRTPVNYRDDTDWQSLTVSFMDNNVSNWNNLHVFGQNPKDSHSSVVQICKCNNHWATMSPIFICSHFKCWDVSVIFFNNKFSSENYVNIQKEVCCLQRRTATRLMVWLASWLWRMITFRGNLLFIWIEKPSRAALQSDNVIMALATQDKQIVLLWVNAFLGFTFLDL